MGYVFVRLLEGDVDGNMDIAGPVDGCLLVIEKGFLEGCVEGRGDG